MSRSSLLLGTLLFGTVVGCSSGASPDYGGDDASGPMDASLDTRSTVEASADVYVFEAAAEAAPEAAVDAAGIDGGPPGVTPSSLDFGLVNCGATGTAKTFSIVNPSDNSVTWTASLGLGAASAFVVSPAGGTLTPGQTAQVTVTPNAVPATSSTSANALGDVVTVALNSSSATVTLTETAQGAVLGFVPTSVAFGPVPISSGATTSFFGVQNTGNASADITLTLTGDPSFSLPNAMTTQSLTATSGTAADSSIIFTPTMATTVNGSVAVTAAAAAVLCAPLPAALTVSGTGTNGQVAVNPTTLVFGTSGLVPCGTNALPQTVNLQNTGSASFTWTSTLTHGSSFYTVSPASGTVLAMTTQIVTVTPKAIPATSTTTAGQYDDTLTLSTNVVGDTPHTVALQETAQGAIVTRSTNSLGFGNVGVGVTSTSVVAFANTGNLDAALSFANGTSNFVQVSPLTVGAGTFASESVSFTPTAVQAYADIGTVTQTTAVPLCGALPGNLTLSGTGTNPTVTATPGSLSFGYVACGTAGTALTVLIQNNGPATTFTAAPLKGALSNFVVTPASGPLTAGGNVTLTVTPQTLPVQSSPTPVTTGTNFYGDTLQVVTGTGTIVDVTLNETALGAILTFSTAKITFTTLTHGTSESSALSVTNTGSGPATVTLTPALTSTVFTGDAGAGDAGTSDPFGVTPASIGISAGGTGPYSATFSPAQTATYNGTMALSIPAGTNLCATLPASVTLTGTGN